MAFNIDLRRRIVATIDDGMSVSEASTVFRVSRRVIYEWLTLREATGSLEPKTGYQKGHSHKITDWDQFREFVKSYYKYTTPKMIEEWEKHTQLKVSESVMRRALRKIGYTFKKNIWLCRS
jgi:transposase